MESTGLERLLRAFVHYYTVWVALVGVNLSITNLVAIRTNNGRPWLTFILVGGTLLAAASGLHNGITCRICQRVRREHRHDELHWTVRLCHCKRLWQIVLGVFALWVLAQFFSPTSVFVYGQIVAIPAILFFAYAWQSHVPLCDRCDRLVGGGGRRLMLRCRPPAAECP